MRKKPYLQLLLATFVFCKISLSQQQPFANRSLSNLKGTTAVSTDLIAKTNNTYTLGSSTTRWKSAYLGSVVFANGTIQTSAFIPYKAGDGITISGKQIINTAPDKIVKLSAGNGIRITGSYPNFTIASIGTSSSTNLWTSSGGSIYCDANIGIGTMNPSAKLEIAGGDAIINGITIGVGGGNKPENMVVGAKALYSNTTGFSNMVNGNYAMYSNTIGYDNSAFGENALYSNIDGIQNTAVGNGTLYYNISGYGNTAIGNGALLSNGAIQDPLGNSSGSYNTANGFFSLVNNTIGSSNAGFGPGALYTNVSGSYNTGLGPYADVAVGNLTNATAIGFNAIVNGDNKVRIGNTDVLIIESSAGSWTTSDGRFKSNVSENVVGLKFINLLRPVVYNFDADKFDEFLSKRLPADVKAKRSKLKRASVNTSTTGVLQTGFIGQEVAKAAQKSGYNFNGVHVPANEDDNYSISYEKMVVPLVKAVQELSAQNEEMKKEIAELKTMLNKGQKQAVTLSNTATLKQNIPNPAADKTSISYILPENATNAEIVFTDRNGIKVKSIKVTGKSGAIDINTSHLSAGSYQYTIYVNGMVTDTKQMVIER